MGRGRAFAGVGAVILAALLAVALPARSDEEPWSESSVRARFPDPDQGAKDELFAENVECKECHDDRVKSLASSFHAKLVDAKKSGTKGCQECHGPGQAHVDDEETPMRNPSRTADLPGAATPATPKAGETARAVVVVPVKESNGACLRCHLEVLTKPKDGQDHRDWIGRTRDPSGERSCVSCHLVHVDKSRPAFDKTIGPFATAKDLAAKSEFADPKQCIACHSEFHPQMARSGHAFLMKEGEDHGCAACHGPGQLHAQSGGDPRKIILPTNQRPADADASCKTCHAKSAVLAKWTCSEHERQGVACIVCHDSNAPVGRTLRKNEYELCGACHLDVQAQFRLPSRHRVAEGRVSCSDCHDPHGNTDKVRDKDVRYRACLSCHQEKAGPFMFDHGIKRTEGCVACHDPHGSTNKRMLTHARIQPMCLQCHPDTPHDLRLRQYDNCLSCHTEIHGSDLDKLFRK